MGKPNGKSMPLPSYVMSYGKNKLRPEFWFSIPKNRTDELYRFLNTWVPQLYGELDENAIKERGFELIQHDTEWIKGGQNKVRSGSFYELIAFIAAHIHTHTHVADANWLVVHKLVADIPKTCAGSLILIGILLAYL